MILWKEQRDRWRKEKSEKRRRSERVPQW